MTREALSVSPRIHTPERLPAAATSESKGCAPHRHRLGRHLGGALRQHGLGRHLGGAVRQHGLGRRLGSSSFQR